MLKRVVTSALAILVTVLTTDVKADLVMSVSEGSSGVVLTMAGSGTATSDGDITDNTLLMGTPSDTFIKDGSSFTQEEDPVPAISLGGQYANIAQHGDANGFLGLRSSIAFFFPTQFADETLNLSDLTGTYTLNDWIFSDFNPGTYSLIASPDAGGGLRDVGDI